MLSGCGGHTLATLWYERRPQYSPRYYPASHRERVMQLRVEDLSPVEKKLIVEVPWDSVSEKLAASYRQLAKSVQLKGFRKGKVPRSVLERMFGDRVRVEVAGEIIRESFFQAINQHKLEAVSEPQVDDSKLHFVKGEPLRFEAVIEVRGDVKAEKYEGMELSRRPLSVPESDIDKALEELQREHTELHPIEGRSELGNDDVVAFSCRGTLGEHQIDRPQMTLDLGDEGSEPLPGLVAALRGLPIETADHQIVLKVPDDHADSEIAGLEAALTISILEARVKDVPDLSDDFAVDTGKGETLEDVRAALRRELEERQSAAIADEVREQALKELIARNPIPVAPSLVERVLQNKYRRLQMMMGQKPHNHDHPIEGELREKLMDGAEDEVRGQLLLEAVAEAESVEVVEEEIDERIAELAARSGQQLGRLKAEMARDGRLENVRFQLRHKKTMDLLVARASVSENVPESPAAE